MAGNKRFGGWLVPTAIVAVLAGVLGSGAMVWSASNAAFSGTTVNPANSWAAGAVTLTDDDGGSAMFNATGMTPSSGNVVKCIVVTYSGTVTPPGTIKLYGGTLGGTPGGLAPYLNITIETGTGGTYANDCSGFGSPTTIYATNTLANFQSARTNFTNGVDTLWTPAPGATRVFRFTASVADNNAANGLNCTMPFTWEAQA